MTDFDPTQNLIRNDLLTIGQLLQLCRAEHGWEVWNGREWVDATDAPQWADEDTYRAKTAPAPKLFITVNGVTNVVAAPVTERLKDGDDYFCPAPCFNDYVISRHWSSDQVDYQRLERGMIHLTEAAARAHAMAMIGMKAEGV